MRIGEIGSTDGAEIFHAESLPNSSAVLAVTVLADIADVVAVIRTAALLGRSFNVSTAVDLPGESAIQIEANKNVSAAVLNKLLQSIEAKLRTQVLSPTPIFTLEAAVTAASFLAAGTISVRIRGTELESATGTLTRWDQMFDFFYVGVAIVFFALLWGFTKASERL
jgi:hypothetical protein